jgi:hypothetical protein
MARTITYWYDVIVAEKQTFPNLNGLQPSIDNSQTLLTDLSTTSKVARWRLLVWCVAVAAWTLDVLFDLYIIDVDAKIRKAIPGTPAWWQQKVFEFQYDAVTPQVIDLVNLEPTYPVVDATKRIVTRCSITTNINKDVIIKVAKGTTTPTPLSGPEIASLAGYVDVIRFAGISTIMINSASDKIQIQAQVFYNGQYSSTIQANVFAAITNYLSSIEFNGKVRVALIEDAIQAVPGVRDVVISGVYARPDAALIGDAVLVPRVYDTYSGYVEEETTGGYDFASTISFFVES